MLWEQTGSGVFSSSSGSCLAFSSSLRDLGRLMLLEWLEIEGSGGEEGGWRGEE